jgi:hypothetical protein
VIARGRNTRTCKRLIFSSGLSDTFPARFSFPGSILTSGKRPLRTGGETEEGEYGAGLGAGAIPFAWRSATKIMSVCVIEHDGAYVPNGLYRNVNLTKGGPILRLGYPVIVARCEGAPALMIHKMVDTTLAMESEYVLNEVDTRFLRALVYFSGMKMDRSTTRIGT